MKVGINTGFTDRSANPAVVARRCEELGFDALYTGDHAFLPVGFKSRYPGTESGAYPEHLIRIVEPIVALTIAAAATTRLRLGTGICLVAERSPVWLAKEIATLDLYSNGRIELGAGAGWCAEEAEIMGVNYRRRWVVIREHIRAMKELWCHEQSSFQGEFIRFPPVMSYPKPVQKPHPPIFICGGEGGFSCERALRDTVALGDGWIPNFIGLEQFGQEVARLKHMCDAAGRDFGALEISVFSRMDGDPRREMEEFRAAGATRMMIYVSDFPPDAVDRILEPLARGYVEAGHSI